MIQIKRGKTESWRKNKVKLAAGQPGYDKDKHKIKIGDGEKTWSELPYASGLSAEEILDSEAAAKARNKLDKDDITVLTYGAEAPSKNTVGQLYLQYYDAEPEADYVVEAGINNGWSYHKWKSGLATCFGVFEITTPIQTVINNNLYQNSADIKKISYPFTFKTAPCEVASVQSPGGLVWLSTTKGFNTASNTAVYSILSADKLTNSATYRISIRAEGFWR